MCWVRCAALRGSQCSIGGGLLKVKRKRPCARPAPLCPHLPGGTALRHCVGTCGHPDPAVPRHLPFFFRQLRPAAEQGSFDFAYTLAQLVTTIQAGFSTYWGPYVYAHYRTEQERIGRIHDLLNLLIFGFFCLLVMFEDIIFIIFPAKSACLPYFPLMMLAVVFSILCEGTVYGNTIARKPFHDTIGTAVGVAANIAVCAVLVPRFGVMGAAVGLVAANATMFLYRTVTGQYYYRTIPSFSRTICGFLLAVGVAMIGVVFAHNFIIKFVLTAAILFIYCNIYRAQLYKLWQIFMGFVRRYLLHSQA